MSNVESFEGAEARLLLKGEKSEFEVVVGSQDMSSNCPQILGSAPGSFHRPVDLIWDSPYQPWLEWMNTTDSGAWVALLDGTGPEKRPTAVLQSNKSAYHRERYAPWAASEKVWRDWWFATLFVAISELSSTIHADDLVIWHPILSANPWGEQMAGVTLEALAHAADQREISFERVAFGCQHDLDMRELGFLARLLNVEAETSHFDEPVVAETSPTSVGLPDFGSGAGLFKVEIRDFPDSDQH